MTEIEKIIQDEINKNLLYDLELQRHANKFFYYSNGGWISENGLLDKLTPPKDDKELYRGNLQAILVALIVTGRAISKTESDNVIRYKFTENRKDHLDFLTKEKEHLENRLSWINKKIEEFENEGN
jgi:hypothetical protein